MVLLAILSASALYGARESLLAISQARLENIAWVLEALVADALVIAHQWIADLPMDSPVILMKEEPNYYLEQPINWYLANNNAAITWFTLPNGARMAMVLESIEKDYLRGSMLLITHDEAVTLRMQATWNRSTLNPTQLGWRRG
jgi:hypothetical protein